MDNPLLPRPGKVATARARPRRRGLNISVRALLLVVLVLGLWLGWRVNRAREQRLAVRTIALHGGVVSYDWHLALLHSPPAPAWVRGMVGDDLFQDVALVDLRNPSLRDLSPQERD